MSDEFARVATTMQSSAFPVIVVTLICVCLPACTHREQHRQEAQKIVVTCPQVKAVTITQEYVCQIHSQRHITIRALELGYLKPIQIKEGQAVKEGDALFSVNPVIYKAKLDAQTAERDVAEMKFHYTEKLAEDKVVSKNEVSLVKAELSRAQAKLEQAEAEYNFATVKAPFDGIVDRLQHQQGGLVEEGEALTTLSDNSLMWVYFNVPEANYLEYITDRSQLENQEVELVLANGKKFSQVGKIGAIEADFNNKTGTVAFRADFPNPNRLLRHGQTGTVSLSHVQKEATVIPQRATFEVLDKRYVYVVDKDDVAHQREIEIDSELEDLFVISHGVGESDKIVLEGIRQVRDGDKVQYEVSPTEKVMADLKYHAE
jgi:membrane fusion protein (multidrug efflux system)